MTRAIKALRLPLLCTLFSAAGFYLATGLGGIWLLAWFAPAPVLWLAFGRTNPMVALYCAIAAAALGGLNLLPAYGGVIPAETLAAAIALWALGFGASVMLGRFAGRALIPAAGPLGFAAAWTAMDYLASLGPNGAILSPAYALARVPVFIGSAAYLGPFVLTFLLGLVAGFVALAYSRRHAIWLIPAAALAVADLAAGAIHLQAPQGPAERVVLLSADSIAQSGTADDAGLALGAVLAYAGEIRMVAKGAGLVVLPERLAVLRPEWQGEAFALLKAASRFTGATIVAGFEAKGGKTTRNIAWTVTPGGAAPLVAVQGEPGRAGADYAVAISHDLDFQDRLRLRMAAEQPLLLAVLAWDFGADAGLQARKAILRGVESGVALARTARDGELTLADALGRVRVARQTEAQGFSIASAEVALAPAAGATLYDRIGDVFGWFAIALSLLLTSGGIARLLWRARPARDLREPFGGILRPAWTAAPLRKS
ncbi:MAG: hypothetical protein KGR48_15300 [Alphaproteobacteria bacterium]|nr:hypothetical protein [Alphaproteobacteria bacterium]MDE2011989.1 hypothetical protein [Alphaproteobacteria bacterium]MDE2074097.1 hypothetical protein [Alphaproteobacteria bacterium]MDE2350355.1 hypothetical protein [Alphaproteobacteria bacterium]